ARADRRTRTGDRRRRGAARNVRAPHRARPRASRVGLPVHRPGAGVRLFFAVNLPADERDRLYRAAAPLRTADLPVRWVPPQNLHVTLRFLGTVAESQVAAVRD